MIGALMGLPGKIKTVYDYLVTNLSPTRTAKLDNLSVNVNTLAISATALSNAQWTNARAGYLDNISTADPTSKSPIASGIVRSLTAPVALNTTITSNQGVEVTTFGSGAFTRTYTGSGVLEYVAVQNVAPLGTNNLTAISLVIDGVTVATSSDIVGSTKGVTTFVGATTFIPYWNGSAVVYMASVSLGSVPFKTGFTVYANGMTSNNGQFLMIYRKTS